MKKTMDKKTEALKLALEALEEIHPGNMTPIAEEAWNKAITAIREALAEHSTNRPTSRLDAYPQEQVAAAKEDVLSAVERHGLSEQPAQQQEPEYKGWYCAHCERGVDGSEVTYHEQHTVCGRVITDDLPPSWDSFFGNAEQPAQQQEQYIGETNVELGFYSDDASNGQQRELVGKVEMGQLVGNRSHESASNPDTEREIAVITGVDEYGPMLGWFKHWINYPVGTKLYTSPPNVPTARASKPLSNLTEDNIPAFPWVSQSAQQQEPVAWRVRRNDGQYELYFVKASAERAAECYIKRPQVEPLYTSPPASKPLTDEQIESIYEKTESVNWARSFARAIEAAHGIKENT